MSKIRIFLILDTLFLRRQLAEKCGKEAEMGKMDNGLLEVSAKEVAGKLGFYTDEAMLRPVGIQKHGVTRVVMLSLREYERLKRWDREVIRVEDLDEETIEALKNVEIPAESVALNYLMDDSEAG